MYSRCARHLFFFLPCSDIPANYHVLFLQGGGTGQFAAVPLNLSRSSDQVADYFVTGLWSKKAAEEAQKYLKVNKVLTHSGQYNSIQEKDHWKLTPGAAYVYYCANETVHGVCVMCVWCVSVVCVCR